MPDFDDLKPPPELTGEERVQAEKVLANMGCSARFGPGSRDLAVLGYLGSSLKFLFDQYPDDTRIRADVALYEAWEALPMGDPTGLGYSREDVAPLQTPVAAGIAGGPLGGRDA